MGFLGSGLTWVRRSGGIPSHMRIRIRAVPTSSHNRSCSKHLGPGRRRRWSSPGSWCSRDTCSTSGATRGPWRAPARRQRRHHRSGDNPCRAGPWSPRCRLRWCEEPHRCFAKDHSVIITDRSRLRRLGRSLNRRDYRKAIDSSIISWINLIKTQWEKREIFFDFNFNFNLSLFLYLTKCKLI